MYLPMYRLKNLINLTKTFNFGNFKINIRNCNSIQNEMCSRIIWIDMEMSGLDVKREKILEVSCLITDEDLNIIAESETIVINQPESVLKNMGEWCTKQHVESKLTEQVRKSKISTEQAEQQLVEFLKTHVSKGDCPLAGNSVYYDRAFLKEYMPKVDEYMHYRIIDVSTVKELCKRWNPSVYSNAPVKQLQHRSLQDIKESINELNYYKKCFFNLSNK